MQRKKEEIVLKQEVYLVSSLWKKGKKRLKGYQLFWEIDRAASRASHLLPVTFSGHGLTVTCVVT